MMYISRDAMRGAIVVIPVIERARGEHIIERTAASGVHIRWSRGDKEVRIEIEDDGTLVYALRVDGTFIPGAVEGGIAASPLPEDLTEYLQEEE